MKAVRFFLTQTLLFTLSLTLQAQPEHKSKGIGLRWGFWNQGNRTNLITYVERDGRESVETAGLGGWVYFFSRSGDDWMFEFSLGAFAQAKEESDFDFDEHLDANITIPILLGLRRDVLSINNSSALRPYISFGGGPYWITNVKEEADLNTEEVVSKLNGGVYFGGGMDFFLSNALLLNFDVRYHAVDLDFEHEISGLEIGLGIGIMWGQYRPPRR